MRSVTWLRPPALSFYGFELFTDVKVIRFPDRYSSSKGEPMWNLVMRLLEEIETEAAMEAVRGLPVSVLKNPTLNLSNTRWACAINWPTKKPVEPPGH